MTVRSRSFVAVVIVATALAVACEGRSSPPTAPSALQNAVGAATPGTLAQMSPNGAQHAVTLFDACDPETFNAAVGPGTCSRSGGVRFEDFVAQLTRHHSIGAWHFAPSEVTMRVGQELVANNRGGEDHTFTEVEEFGGGNLQFLNDLVGLETIAPECNAAVVIPPGGSSHETEHEAGVEKYQCCIHPWMRAEVRIVDK
jgi:plastocyanin